MALEIVIDEKTEAKYELVKIETHGGEKAFRLGMGALGNVYLYKLIQGEGVKEVAIKELLPQHRPGTEAYLDFLGELDVITALEAALQGREGCARVPWAHRGFAPQDKNQVMLIMEYIPEEWRLTKKLTNNILPEELGLKTMAQYAGLLNALHNSVPKENSGYSVRGDRKGGDFYWDEKDEGLLIVLDWNRSTKLPDKEYAKMLKRQDLHGLGQIWSEFLLGESMRLLPDPFDENNDRWNDLSLGTRQLLRRAMSGLPLEAGDFEKETKIHLDNFQRSRQDPGGLLSKIEKTEIKTQPESVLVLADLVIRSKLASDEQRDQATSLFDIALLERDPGTRTDEFIKVLKQKIKESNFDGALALIWEKERELDAEKNKDFILNWSKLRLKRYESFTYFLQSMSGAKLHINNIFPSVMDAISFLESLTKGFQKVDMDFLIKMYEAFDKLEIQYSAIPQALRNSLSPIIDEAKILKLWYRGIEKEKTEEAHQYFKEAYDQWKILQDRDLIVAELVRLTFSNLADYVTLEQENSKDAYIREILTRLDHVMADIKQLFEANEVWSYGLRK